MLAAIRHGWDRLTGNEVAGDDPFSIVMLLREWAPRDEAALRAAVERAYSGKEVVFLGSKGAVTLVKVGVQLLSLIQVPRRYDLEMPEHEILDALDDEAQRNAWRAHRAWMAIDTVGRKIRRKEGYGMLARTALALGDANCCGIYFPRDGGVRANDGSAETALRQLVEE